jgi:hypothetical protein
MKPRLIFVAMLSIAISTTLPSRASAVDALSWYSTYSAADGDVLTGTKRLFVQSNTSGYITKWCVYLDGNPLTGRQYEDDYRPIGLTSSVYWSSRQQGSTGAPDQTSPGCWEFSSTQATTGFDISVDTSTWSNGSHAIKIEATPSTGSVHSKIVNVTTTNTLPAVEWVTQSGQTASDYIFLTAKLRPGGVPRIAKACLYRNGTPVNSSDNISFEGDTPYGGMNSYQGPDGQFGSSTDGCVLFTELQSNSWPPGLHQLTTLSIRVPTVRWTDQINTLTLSMIDAVDRVFSTPISFTVSNSKPKTVITAMNNATIWENVEFQPTFSPSGSALSRMCINGSVINDRNVTMSYYHSGTSGTISPVNGCWTASQILSGIESQHQLQNAKIKFDTQLMANGIHTVTLTSTDELGKSDTSTHSFTVNNGSPSVKISTPAPNALLNNWIVLTAESSMPTYMRSTGIRETCVSLANSNSCSSSNTGFISSLLNTSCLSNGSSTISATTLDTAGKTGSNATPVVIRNGQPTTNSVKIKSNSPAWNSKSINGRVSLNASAACSYRIEILDAKGKRTAERISGDFQSKSQYEAELFFSKLKPSTKYKVRITLTNSSGTKTRTQTFSTPSLPPRPKVNLIAKLCPVGTNLEVCVGRTNSYPMTLDCTFVRRNWKYNAVPYWIIGYRSGTPVISKSPYGCA